MIALGLLALLAAAPGAETVGSVDGPFLWADVRGSVDDTRFPSDGAGRPLPGLFAGGTTVLAQGQLFGGWGLRLGGRRLALCAAVSGTAVVTDPYWLVFGGPRFDVAPLLLSAAMPLSLNRLVLVPMLGVTLPTRAFFNSDPILAVQPQLRVRAGAESLLVGGSVFVNLPAITKWR